jgi:1-acyl-sn-glycerol-3-phosphate acyltransferase
LNFYYWSIYNAAKLLARIFFRYRVLHRERMINQGPVIVAANHASYLDPLLVGIVPDRGIFFLARKTLLNGFFFAWLLPKLNVIPVDQSGNDRSALKALIRTLQAREGVLVFPEGERTFDGRLGQAQPGLGFVIAKTLAPVVPVRVFGAREVLPRGAKGIQIHPITVVVGEPIYYQASDFAGAGKDVYLQVSQRVMDAIAGLTID